MNAKELLKCCEQLDVVATNFAAIPGNSKAVEAALHCRMAQTYVIELAHHLASGMEPFDAVEATARGILQISPSAATVMQILTAKPKQ
jgi:hypothetical protein